MQNYLNILEEKGIGVVETSKLIQKAIDAHEKRVATYNQLNELIENDQIDEDEIDETKEKLQNLAEIIEASDQDLCKRLKKFNLESYAKNLANLSNATAKNSKTNGKKKTEQTPPVAAAVVVNTPPPAQEDATIATQALAQAAQVVQIPSATIDGKKVEIKEEKPKKTENKKSNAGGIILGLVLGIAATLGIGAAINQHNKNSF